MRSLSASALRARIGVDFGFDTLHTKGVRGLSIQGLRFDMPLPGFGHILLTADALDLTLSLSELFRGHSAIGKAEVSGAHLIIDIPEDAGELNRDEGGYGVAGIDLLIAKIPSIIFQGTNCSVECRMGEDKPPVILENIEFTVSKDTEFSKMQVTASSRWTAEGKESTITVDGVYRSPNMIDATLDANSITPAHLAPFVAFSEQVSGNFSASLHTFGMINKQLMAELEVEINDIEIPEVSGIPVINEPVSGTIDAALMWDVLAKQLHLCRTSIGSNFFSATAMGSIEFSETPVFLDIEADISDIPVNKLLTGFIPEQVAQQGKMDVVVSPASLVTVRAQGSLEKPKVEGRISVPELTVAWVPTDKKHPEGQMRIEQIQVVWDDFSKLPAGTANLVAGTVIVPPLGIEVVDLAGTVSFDGEQFLLRPITAAISEKPWSGTVSYKISDSDVVFDINGTLTEIEKTPLYDLVNDLCLGGDISVRGRGSLGLDGHLKLQANADITRGMVAFEWWLKKPVGVGASIHNLAVDLVPGKTLQVQGEASIEDTQILADLDFVYSAGKFQQKRIRVELPHLEVNSAGKCIQIPYTARGEICRDGYYESNIIDGKLGDKIAKIGGHFDYVSFLPDGGENPLICRDAEVLVTLTDIEGEERTADLVLHVAEAHVPPFADNWILPIGPSDEYEEKKEAERDSDQESESLQTWTYTFSADKISVPPWEGNNFEAELYSNDKETGFKFYRADVGSGQLEGTYLHQKAENTMQLDASWDSIPATYLIRHLELPEILAGDITGNMTYVVDRDDPRTTMHADGKFSVANGHFIPEELAFMLADTLGSSFITLHPDALKFNEVSSAILIEGDKIDMTGLVIDSEGMRITGDGVWVMEGDLDYNIKVAITPDMAEQIPLLMDYFNVQGFRMTQQNIELGFHLTGPTFQPSGELAGLPPIGVTLVSGAAEMTGEAFKLLDTPRQMFMSIFRVGGGILGATRTQKQQQAPQQ
ncbi:MAG: hypothetical protein KAH38_02920 [Candidatus Hydrogenedentes bacterium]|nr:hypothetical protein [Candidatus Hydrogenedentota bacterium]